MTFDGMTIDQLEATLRAAEGRLSVGKTLEKTVGLGPVGMADDALTCLQIRSELKRRRDVHKAVARLLREE